MKFIIHAAPADQTAILHVRAAREGFRLEAGCMKIVEFQDGSSFEVRRNARSISVWPLQNWKLTARAAEPGEKPQ